MKRIFILISVAFLVHPAVTSRLTAQEWSTGLDIYSSYIWRGTKFGSGPAFQPSVEFSAGGLALGAWGSYSASDNEAAEADLYASYELSLGESASLTFTVTDYYFPGSSWLQKDSHFIEPMVNLGIGGLNLTGAYMMNSGEGELYLEAGFAAGSFNLFIGAGDGAYTVDGEFDLCNIGIGSSKDIVITESFSLPVSGAFILNPSSEQFHVVAGISF